MIVDSIEREGFKLRYIVEGDGIPVLICGSALYYSRTFSKILSEHCKMIYFDNRVFGGTALKDVDQSDFKLESIYDDFEALRQHLDLGSIVILGHSGQSYMALEYAKKYPNSVSHVVMIGMAPTYDEEAHQLAELNWQSIASAERKKVLEKNLIALPDEEINQLPEPQNFIKDYVRKTPIIWYDYNYNAELLWDDVEFNSTGFNYIWGELFPKLDITNGLENFSVPVSVMVGKYDGLIAPPITWNKVKGQFKHIEINVFDKSGHTPQLEQSELFNEKLLAFIEKKID